MKKQEQNQNNKQQKEREAKVIELTEKLAKEYAPVMEKLANE